MTLAKYGPIDIARWEAKIASGKSKRQIAVEEGISPGALIGAMHRAGGGTKIPRAERKKAEKKPKVQPGVKMPLRPDTKRPDQDGPDIIALPAGRCKFPVTHDRPYKFCGEKAEHGKPYCKHHSELAYDNSAQNAARFDNAVKWLTPS
jgi:hypothetical protein